jgi:hypothetical protein
LQSYCLARNSRNTQDEVETWVVPMQVAGTMPVLALALRGAGAGPLDLGATYADTRRRCRL